MKYHLKNREKYSRQGLKMEEAYPLFHSERICFLKKTVKNYFNPVIKPSFLILL